jgi:hypothetical protein
MPGREKHSSERWIRTLTGRVETPQRGGEAFAVVRDLDPVCKETGASHSPALRSRTSVELYLNRRNPPFTALKS